MPKSSLAPLRILPPPRLLAAGRVLAGLSQRELAVAAGIAISSLGRFEMGASMLRVDTMDALLAVLADHGIQFVQEGGKGIGVMLVGELKPKIPRKRLPRTETAMESVVDTSLKSKR